MLKKGIYACMFIILICSISINIYILFHEKTLKNVEIEKKWLINPSDIPYDLTHASKFSIEQTYINFNPEIRVRRINAGEMYTLTLKTNLTKDGLKRNEYEIFITEAEYNTLIGKKEGNTIFKDRYQIAIDDNDIAFDIFKGDLTGLAYMEIEFASEDIANEFVTPNWVIRDVTDDIRYKNGHLARYGIPRD